MKTLLRGKSDGFEEHHHKQHVGITAVPAGRQRIR
jgi:hypothetical protein